METKFHLLPIGHHFEWEGKRYVKTTPLVANQTPSGGQRFIPRSALVTIIESGNSAPPVEPTLPRQIDLANVQTAIDHSLQRCLELSAAAQGPEELRQGIAQAYHELREALNLPTT